MKVKYRTINEGLNPRRTKLEVPGWGGQSEPRADGSLEHPWHCVPFSEGARYGIELSYPYDNELRVSTRNGKLIFEGDFGPPPSPGLPSGHRSARFGTAYYTYQILLDLKVELGYAIAPSRIRAFTPIRPTLCRSRYQRCCAIGGR